MASLRNAMKTQHVHRERHQPQARQHLGPLEKKKDYRIRAKDQNEKQKAIATLRKRALNKNPDEFRYHMINSGLKDGVHYEKVEDEVLVVSNVSQDLTYISHRRSIERKKIEKLKAQLHMLDVEDQQKNTHILFVDDDKEAKVADPAEILETHPSLLGRSFNRLRTSQLSALDINLTDASLLKKISNFKRKTYKELSQRIERENKLRIMQEKLEVKKKLMENKAVNGEKPKLVKAGTNKTAPVYEWPQIRKK